MSVLHVPDAPPHHLASKLMLSVLLLLCLEPFVLSVTDRLPSCPLAYQKCSRSASSLVASHLVYSLCCCFNTGSRTVTEFLNQSGWCLFSVPRAASAESKSADCNTSHLSSAVPSSGQFLDALSAACFWNSFCQDDPCSYLHILAWIHQTSFLCWMVLSMVTRHRHFHLDT